MRQIASEEEEEMPISPGPNSSAPEIFTSKRIFFLNSSCSRRSEIPHIETDYCRRDEVSRRLFHHNSDLCDCDCASDGCGGCIRRNKQCFFKFFVLGLSIALILLLFGSLSYNLTRNKDADESFDFENTQWVSHHHEYSKQSAENVSAPAKIEPVLDLPVPVYEHPDDYDTDEDLRVLQYHLDVHPDRIEPIPVQPLEDNTNSHGGVVIIYDGREPPRMKRSISSRSKTKESDLIELEKSKRDTDSELFLDEVNGVEEGMEKFWESFFQKGRTVFEPFSLTTPSYSTPIQNDDYSDEEEEEEIGDALKNLFWNQFAVENFNPVTSQKTVPDADTTPFLEKITTEETRFETTTEILTSDVKVADTTETDSSTTEIEALSESATTETEESSPRMEAPNTEFRMESIDGRNFRTWPLFQFPLPFSGLFGSNSQDRIIPDSTPPDTVKGISLADAKKIKKEKRKHLLLNSRVVGGSSDVRLPTGPDVSKPFVNAFETLKTNQQLSFTPSATSQFILPYQMCLFAGPFPGYKPSAHGIQPRTFSFGAPPLFPSIFDKTPQPSKSPQYQAPAQQNFLSFSINNYPNGPPRPFQPSGGSFYNFPNQPPPNKQPIFCTYLQPPLFQFPTVPGTADFSHAKCVDCQGEKDVTSVKETAFPSGRETICADDKVSCLDGSCIPVGYWCDNQVHCKDASDEAFCSCRERVAKDRLCDGYVDCPHGEDETGCFDCPKSAFSCGSFVSPGSCIPLSKRCDGVRDCATGADESDCSALFFHVRQNDSYHVSQVSGYLHRNWKGDWFPVCVELADNIWATEACAGELGAMTGNVEVRFAPVTQHYKGPFLVREEDGTVALQDHCKGHVSTYVTCPPINCGTRVELYNFARSHLQDKDIIVKRTVNDSEVINQDDGSRLRREETGRVVGGRESEPKAWPWAIAVYKNGAFHCGGVILDENWVLTAAHCMEQYWKHYYEVRGGMLRRFSYSAMEQARSVSHVIIHENYDLSIMSNDLALLRVNEPFHFNRWVRPACLPVLQDGVSKFISGPAPGTRCTAVGWGALRERGTDPDQLREVEIPIMSRCKHKEDLVGEEICAGKLEGGKDTCQGDSGGPLLCRDSGSPASWYVAGIVSHGEGCARPGEPGAYTRVSLFVDWITANTNDFQLPSVKPLQSCPGFRCRSASKLCIPRKWVCNGFTDCLEAEDEKNCSNSANRKYSTEDKFFGEGDVEREKFGGIAKAWANQSPFDRRNFEITEKFLKSSQSSRIPESVESTTITDNDFGKKNGMIDQTTDGGGTAKKITITTEGFIKRTENQESTPYEEVTETYEKTENGKFEKKYNKENEENEKENVSGYENLTTERVVARTETEKSRFKESNTYRIGKESDDKNAESVSLERKYNEKDTTKPEREKTTKENTWDKEKEKLFKDEDVVTEREEVTTDKIMAGTESDRKEKPAKGRSWNYEVEKLFKDEVVTKGIVAETETTERFLIGKEKTPEESTQKYEEERSQSTEEIVAKTEIKEVVTTESVEEEENRSTEEIPYRIESMKENVEKGTTEFGEGEKTRFEEATTEDVVEEESRSTGEIIQRVGNKMAESLSTTEKNTWRQEEMATEGEVGEENTYTATTESETTEGSEGKIIDGEETRGEYIWKHEEVTTEGLLSEIKTNKEREEEISTEGFVARTEKQESEPTEGMKVMIKNLDEESLEEKYTEKDKIDTAKSAGGEASDENIWKNEEEVKLSEDRITTERILESQFHEYLRVTDRPEYESKDEIHESKNNFEESEDYAENLKMFEGGKTTESIVAGAEITTERVVEPTETQFHKYLKVTYKFEDENDSKEGVTFTEDLQKDTTKFEKERTIEDYIWKNKEDITTERIVTEAGVITETVVEPTETPFYKHLKVTERFGHENDTEEGEIFAEDLKKDTTKFEKEITTDGIVAGMEVTTKRVVESTETSFYNYLKATNKPEDENDSEEGENFTEDLKKESEKEITTKDNIWENEEEEKLSEDSTTTESVVEPTETQFNNYLKVTKPEEENEDESDSEENDNTEKDTTPTSSEEITSERVVALTEKPEMKFYKHENVSNRMGNKKIKDLNESEELTEKIRKTKSGVEYVEAETTSRLLKKQNVKETQLLLTKIEEATEPKPEITTKTIQTHSIRTRKTPEMEEYPTPSFDSSTDLTIDDRLDSDYFQCRKIVQSILPTYRCDGEEDCEDGSDEENCSCVQVFQNSNPEYLCDGRAHCPDGSDEKNCSKCRQNEFYCERSKQCISSFERCDGMSDCTFGEDEAKCLSIGESPDRLLTEGMMMRNTNGVWKVACQEESVPFGAGDAIKVCSKLGTVGYERYENRSLGANCTGFYVTCSKSLSRSVEKYKLKNGTYLWPWNGVVYSDGRAVCSGVLLRPRWFLASSHCLRNVSLSKNYLTAKFEDETTVRIDSAQPLPESNAVLLHLSQEIIPSKSVRPLGLPYVFESDPEKDVCIAVGDRTVFLKIQKHCQRDTRCYKKMTSTPTGCTSRPWTGVVVCQSRFGWYPSSTFSEKRGYCGFEHVNFTTLQENLRYIMDKNVNVFPEPVCNGFRCPQGVCIPHDKMCDGKADCSGKEDESFGICASKKQIKECKITEMKCRNGRCIPKVLFGDGIKDCEDGSDEPSIITCVDYLRLTSPERICDGRRNCYDKTDEDYRLCACDEFKFQCKLSGYCIPKDFVCDGEKDCPGGEDEEQCMGRKIIKNHNKTHLEVMRKSYGIWHTMCPTQMSKQRSDTFCKDLGFNEALFTYSRNQTVIFPQTDPFSWVKLNQKTSIGLRGNKPFVRLVTLKKTCDSVKCA